MKPNRQNYPCLVAKIKTLLANLPIQEIEAKAFLREIGLRVTPKSYALLMEAIRNEESFEVLYSFEEGESRTLIRLKKEAKVNG